MTDDVRALIRDTLLFLKDPSISKQPLFAATEDYAFFRKKIEAVKPTQILEVAPSLPKIPLSSSPRFPKPQLEPIQKSENHSKPVTEEKTISVVLHDNLSAIKKMVQKIAPQYPLVDQVPDDLKAKRIANAWKEKIPDVEVILLACDIHNDTLELLKNLARAIDQNLAKCKVVAAERMEKEKRWDFFLEKNAFRLIIASSGIKELPGLMQHYRSNPASSQHFLGQIPLLLLAQASVYKSLEHKAHLWKILCQMLKKS